MAAQPKSLSIIKDDVSKLFGDLTELTGRQVLVGIPAENAQRNDGDAANNALIGYVMEFGSPAQNIPARAFLVPGVKNVQAAATEQLKLAAEAILDKDRAKSNKHLNAAGLLAVNAVRAMITSNIPPPLKPGTIAARARQRGTKSKRGSEIKYAALLDTGATPASAQSATGIIALVNTAQLRNSITYVIRKA